MKDLWERLELYLRRHAPQALDGLYPGATDGEIRDAEAQLGVKFPCDFADSLRIHNGQRPETGTPPYSVPFVPAEHEPGEIYRATWGEFAPLPQMVATTIGCRSAIKNLWGSRAANYEYDGPVRRDGNWSWIIFLEPGSGDMLGLDLAPAEAGHVGQILSIIHDPTCLLVLASSFREWFETLVTRYETGRYVFMEVDGELEPVDRLDLRRMRRIGVAPQQESSILRFPR